MRKVNEPCLYCGDRIRFVGKIPPKIYGKFYGGKEKNGLKGWVHAKCSTKYDLTPFFVNLWIETNGYYPRFL